MVAHPLGRCPGIGEDGHALGNGGLRTTTTGSRASRAAVSFGAVAAPPLSLVTRTSMRWCRSSSRSPSRVKGPRSSSTSMRGGCGGSGASTDRTRNHRSSRPAKASRPMRPVVRKTRRPSAGSARAASPSDATSCHRSPATGTQPGRRRASRGTWLVAAACAALKLIVPAKGWVASTTASTAWSRSHAASPSAPPKPPTRVSPGGRRGRRPVPRGSWSASGRGCRAAVRRDGGPPWYRPGSVRAWESGSVHEEQ